MRNTSYIRESGIERYFVQQVEKAGGLAYKWVSPGNPGVPDRIVFFNGIVHFVELKAPRGKLDINQIIQKQRLGDLSFEVHVIKTKEQAKLWVELNASIAKQMAEKRNA